MRVNIWNYVLQSTKSMYQSFSTIGRILWTKWQFRR